MTLLKQNICIYFYNQCSRETQIIFLQINILASNVYKMIFVYVNK